MLQKWESLQKALRAKSISLCYLVSRGKSGVG